MNEKLADYRLCLGENEYLPLIVGGMGVDISTAELALEIARLGGVGHISDAMSPFLSDRKFGTHFQADKGKKFKIYRDELVKPEVKWGYEDVYRASLNHVRDTMDHKRGTGGVFINVMEKLNMGNPRETLKARLDGAMDGGIDGITLSAGLHKSTLPLITEHSRFHDVKIGIIVSSARALKVFLATSSRVNRLPDYVVVEGPLAGGHLGFGKDWANFNLRSLTEDVLQLLKEEELSIPVIPAGGVFTGTDAVDYLRMGASAVQVATRFTIARECGLPDNVQQTYILSKEEDVEVNLSSPTGYPMRMLKSSPSLVSNIRPNCESLGYILDAKGQCAYIDAWHAAPVGADGKKLPVTDKMCICTHFMNYDCYTCGHYVYRLKDTTVKMENGEYFLPGAEHIFNDYMTSVEHKILLPEVDKEADPASSDASVSRKVAAR